MKALRLIWAAVVLLFAGCGREPAASIYVNPATTTPQFAWLKAERDGRLAPFGAIERRTWRSAVQFQALLLGGTGDFWIGSVETMARARQAGAPVKLLAVTGWRKWVLVGPNSCADWHSALDGVIATAPPGNPARTLLQTLYSKPIRFRPMEGKALALELVQGNGQAALLAEPLATGVLAKNPAMKRLAAIEDIKAELAGGEPRVPWAAIAINERSPLFGRCGDILRELRAASESLDGRSPEEIAALWPEEYRPTISASTLLASLADGGDAFLLVEADACRAELAAYLRMAAPDVPWDEELVYR